MTSNATTRITPHRRRFLAATTGLAGLLVVAPMALGLVAPAAAHSELESASPASGATVTTAPTRITLTFNEDIQDVGDGIVVVAPNGKRVDTGETIVKGVTASQPLSPSTRTGTYTVRYRIVSADGHVVSSSYRFVYRPPVERATRAATTPSPDTTPVAADGTTTSDSSNALPLLFGGIAVLAAIGAVIGLVIRRRGSATPGANG